MSQDEIRQARRLIDSTGRGVLFLFLLRLFGYCTVPYSKVKLNCCFERTSSSSCYSSFLSYLLWGVLCGYKIYIMGGKYKYKNTNRMNQAG